MFANSKSNSVVLLSKARKAGDVEGSLSTSRDEELVSNLHNPAFTPGTATGGETARPTRTAPPGSATYYQQCRPFLDGFFTGLHCIQPIIDKASFLAKCTTLWKAETAVSQSFIALYYSLLSLGALISIRDDEPLDGIENLEWSRIFFEEARSRVGM
ncbi:C6 transcription factor, partial [Fusarium albosuccineum]